PLLDLPCERVAIRETVPPGHGAADEHDRPARSCRCAGRGPARVVENRQLAALAAVEECGQAIDPRLVHPAERRLLENERGLLGRIDERLPWPAPHGASEAFDDAERDRERRDQNQKCGSASSGARGRAAVVPSPGVSAGFAHSTTTRSLIFG